jgi:hypothetical protein
MKGLEATSKGARSSSVVRKEMRMSQATVTAESWSLRRREKPLMSSSQLVTSTVADADVTVASVLGSA